MLKKIILGIVMFATFQHANAERGNPRVEINGITVDEMIADFMEEHDIPGMTLAIVQAPYIPRVVGYGRSDVQNKLLASPKTLWNIGQITCGYTAVAIMQLVEEEKLTIDDSLATFLTDIPIAWRPTTLRQLMGHTSGIPDYTKQPSFDFSKPYLASEILTLLGGIPLEFPSGSKVSKSATNFFLLGLVIEKASGMTHEEYIKKNQIERLGLKNTLFPSELQKQSISINPAEQAMGYNDQSQALNANSQGAWNSYGSLMASAEDISLWDIGLAGDILIKKKANRDFLYNAITLNDGTKINANCGWRFYGHPGLMSIQGNIPGFSCFLSRFTDPSELLCVTLCANKENIDLTELARNIAGAFDARLGPPIFSMATRCFESCFSVETTMDRLEEFLKSKGVAIMARVDHSVGAKKVNLNLRPTQTLIFGNPAQGTHLMLANQAIALDLPLKVAVWEEENGSVWLSCNNLEFLAKSYDIHGIDSKIEQMTNGLSGAIKYAIEPY